MATNGHGERPGRRRLDRALARVSDAPLREGNGLHLLKNGPDTYEDWLAAIARAERWVHLDNYIFQADEIGHRFAAALGSKAESGVRVRVLYDWFGCLDVPRSFWKGLRRAGAEVRPVNPPAFGYPLGVIRRDHRKLLVVDGEYASTGGVCIADGWMVRSPENGLPYRDTAVSVRGPAVADLDLAFAGLWDESGAAPLPEEERPGAGGIARSGDGAARVVIQEPQKLRTLRFLQLLTAGVEERLWITDPYFLSMPILTQSLMAAAGDGVDVRVLTPATNDLPWIGALSRTGYRQFLEAGVRIFEYAGPMIHAKTVVADGWYSKVGSTNLNFSSLSANWEIDLVVEDAGFAAQMEALFEQDLANAREVNLVRSGRTREVQPERPMRASDRRARRGVAGTGSGAGATAFRVGNAALRKGSVPLQTHERTLAGAISGAVLLSSLLTLRFPRILAWPLALLGSVFGGLGVIRALRASLSRDGRE
ncbi:cardiolipin synthase B [Rubrobacter tropicus]|uniref:Cardiolipin synthase B n=1 Tax=Rubrobacter tropicus TaxID=2653851 RepID=A0A6G8Q9W8_9ACTN|nr:phospholipase D-like domain-containing protein [Rubrobacter tropicus]QIN83266.1 cardiolipin synthase B [Rubrobacter tropicus]